MIYLVGPDFEGDIPSWFVAALGICYLVYHICDNTDGK